MQCVHDGVAQQGGCKGTNICVPENLPVHLGNPSTRVAKSMAEIFIFKEDLSKAQESLDKLNFLVQCPPVLTAKDIPRRAATYNRSFSQELTMATFQDFPKSLQWEFLNHAEQRIPFLPQHRQLLVKAKIQRERLWVSTPPSPVQM
jgi:hypothetical protein